MSYSNLYFIQKNRQNLTLLLILPFVLLFSVWFFIKETNTPIKAQKKELKQMEIVNLSTNQAGIYWQTAKKETGWVVYGESRNQLNNIVFDERDLQENKKQYINHYAVLKNLKSNKEYYFKIVSNKQLIEKSNNSAFSFKTSDIKNGLISLTQAYGKVIMANGSSVENAFVLLKAEGLSPLITLTKSTGEWLIPLNKSFSEKNKFEINIFDEDGNKTKIVSSLKNINPIPQTLIIGQDYQFIQEENVLAESISGVTLVNRETKTIDIIYPVEGAIIPGEVPLVSGLAIPENEININFGLEGLDNLTAKADKKGKWEFAFPSKLKAGDYIMTIMTKDEENKNVSLKRKFTIAKNGEQVRGLATESANPIVSIRPTDTIAPTTVPTIESAGFDPTFLTFSSAVLIIVGLGFLLAF